MNLAMQTVLVDLLVVVSLLLVLMVLLQRSWSDGLGTLSGGALEATLGPNAAGGVAWCDRMDGRCILDQFAPLDCPYVI
jgi:protein translocase SecG subunit